MEMSMDQGLLKLAIDLERQHIPLGQLFHTFYREANLKIHGILWNGQKTRGTTHLCISFPPYLCTHT